MTRTIQKRKEYYRKNFKASLYHDAMYDFFHSGLNVVQFNMSAILQFLKSGRFKGSKLLDLGSGPTIHNIASASAYFPNIVLSDFLDDNCAELKLWLSKKSNLNWDPYLKVVAKLEGYNNNLSQGRATIESRIRRTVKTVVHCDLLRESVVSFEDLNTLETSPAYDMVVAVYCINAIAENIDEFVEIMMRISRLVRRGGGLILCEYLNGSPWCYGGNVFPYLKMGWEDYIMAFDESGFGNLEIKVHNRPESNHYMKFDKALCIAAEKL